MRALDIEAVQAFVLTADFKSFTRAAEAMDTTQSAVSLKIKRLEDGLGRRLLERTPRLVRLSADGTRLPRAGAATWSPRITARSAPSASSSGGSSSASAITSSAPNCRCC